MTEAGHKKDGELFCKKVIAQRGWCPEALEQCSMPDLPELGMREIDNLWEKLGSRPTSSARLQASHLISVLSNPQDSETKLGLNDQERKSILMRFAQAYETINPQESLDIYYKAEAFDQVHRICLGDFPGIGDFDSVRYLLKIRDISSAYGVISEVLSDPDRKRSHDFLYSSDANPLLYTYFDILTKGQYCKRFESFIDEIKETGVVFEHEITPILSISSLGALYCLKDRYDGAIAIARGGLGTGFQAKTLGLDVDIIHTKRAADNSVELVLPAGFSFKKFQGKKILLLDDDVHEGFTTRAVSEALRESSPDRIDLLTGHSEHQSWNQLEKVTDFIDRIWKHAEFHPMSVISAIHHIAAQYKKEHT